MNKTYQELQLQLLPLVCFALSRCSHSAVCRTEQIEIVGNALLESDENAKVRFDLTLLHDRVFF